MSTRDTVVYSENDTLYHCSFKQLIETCGGMILDKFSEEAYDDLCRYASSYVGYIVTTNHGDGSRFYVTPTTQDCKFGFVLHFKSKDTDDDLCFSANGSFGIDLIVPEFFRQVISL